MNFSQTEFLIFFALVFPATWVLAARPTARKVVLLVASYYFYAFWDWRFLSLILISTIIDYLVGLRMAREDNPRLRKALVVLSLVSNLGILGFFKYFNFFIENLQVLLQPLGIRVETLGIILPIGISFYTFQTLSYTIDVYRRRIPATTSLLDFAVFVAFFPQLVAGPIVRAADFLPQLARTPRFNLRRVESGAHLFAAGFFKKVFVADTLAIYVDSVFANYALYGPLTVWLGVLAYTLQIYFDFSGYSEMAIGCARMLGFRLPQNFNFPYVALGFSDFWRRWHISLSGWLRDYLYISLGGNRHGTQRTYFNLFATMLLGGLWHGAAWNFVIWGAIHGAALIFERLLRPALRPFVDLARASMPRRVLIYGAGWLATFFVVIHAWVFFRAQDLGSALGMLQSMYSGGPRIEWISPFVIAALLGTTVTHVAQLKAFGPRFRRGAPFLDATRSAVLLALALYFRPGEFAPFIYFQF